jgi:hypothetical protein
MELTPKEKELLKMIGEAQRMGRPIEFRTKEDVNQFAHWRDTYQSLSDKLLIDGNIDLHCYLILMGTGEKVLDKILMDDKTPFDSAKKKSAFKSTWAIVVYVIGLLASLITIWQFLSR